MRLARLLGIVFGIIFLFTSFGLLFGGTVVIVINETLSDSDDFITTPTYQIQDSEVVAIVFQSFSFSDENPTLSTNESRWFSSDINPGDFVKFKIKASNMFIGIAESVDLQGYLDNVSYLHIQNLGFDFIQTIAENPGLSADFTTFNPISQVNWIAKGESELIWNPERSVIGQELTVIIMNIDGSVGITTELSAGAQIPLLQAIGIGLIVFGVIFMILAVVFFVVAAKSRGKPKVDRYRIYRDPAVPIIRPEQPELQYCPNCGGQLDSDSRFCSSCGEPIFSSVEGVPAPKASQPTDKSGRTQFTAKDMLPITSPKLPQNAFVVADWGTRFWAFLIDAILVNIGVELVRWTFIALTRNWNFITDWTFFSFGFSLNGIAMLAYFTYAEGRYGTTLGKQALGLITVTENGELATYGEIFVSAIGKAFLLPIDVIIGLFMQDPPVGKTISFNQRLFQRISKTVTVFRPPPGVDRPREFLSSNLLK